MLDMSLINLNIVFKDDVCIIEVNMMVTVILDVYVGLLDESNSSKLYVNWCLSFLRWIVMWNIKIVKDGK